MVDDIRKFPSPTAGSISGGVAGGKKQKTPPHSAVASARRKPFGADENFVPTNESLASLIKNALLALKEGNYWDRGSVVNLLV